MLVGGEQARPRMRAGTQLGQVVDRRQRRCQLALTLVGADCQQNATLLGAALARRSTCAGTCPGLLDESRQRRHIMVYKACASSPGYSCRYPFKAGRRQEAMLEGVEQARQSMRLGTQLGPVVNRRQCR